MSNPTRYWVGFAHVPHIGSARVSLLLRHFGSLESAWHASEGELLATGLGKPPIRSLLRVRDTLDLDHELARIEEQGLSVLTWLSSNYPTRLRQIAYSPPVVYVRGELISADEWAVAIVGTRNSSHYGEEITKRFATRLANAGVTIVSGLALGIDGIAHRSALEAGGRTIACMAHGLDTVYPARHRRLAEQVIESGALVSDFHLGVRPEARNFPARNRIISGLSVCTLVIEAGDRSGALITAKFAADQKREVFAIPGSLHSRTSRGCNEAIKRGLAKLVTSPDDILEAMNLFNTLEQQQVREDIPDTPEEAALLALIRAEPTPVDEIVRGSGMDASDVTATLLLLELKGRVQRAEGTSYVTTP